jgi:F0F1-type ATP synthase assembly protein I
MRRVPIWKALAGTAAGSTIGFVVGYWLGWLSQRQPLWSVAGTLIGFLVAALLLRLTSRSRVEAVPEGGR